MGRPLRHKRDRSSSTSSRPLGKVACKQTQGVRKIHGEDSEHYHCGAQKEKEQREYNDKVNNLLHGYDTNKYAMVTCRLPQLQDDNSTTHEVKLLPPIKGTHAYVAQQKLYESIHHFIAQGKWMQSNEEENVSGATWLELFIQFDALGWRQQGAEYDGNPRVTKRAAARSARKKAQTSRPTTSKHLAKQSLRQAEGRSTAKAELHPEASSQEVTQSSSRGSRDPPPEPDTAKAETNPEEEKEGSRSIESMDMISKTVSHSSTKKTMGSSTCIQPKLAKELANFKAIVRSIVKNDVAATQQDMFGQSIGKKTWRLKEFAVTGQQPAIKVIKRCTKQENETVEKAIMLQRMGANAVQVKETYENKQKRKKTRE